MIDLYYLHKQTKYTNRSRKKKKLGYYQCSTFENINVFCCKIFFCSSGFTEVSLTLPLILSPFLILVLKTTDSTCQTIYEHLMEPKFRPGVELQTSE